MCFLIRNIVIGNLWSVTDRDADLLTIDFLKKLTSKKNYDDNLERNNDIIIASKDVQVFFKKNL